MRISPKQLLQGLLYLTPITLLALASCGGGGGGSTAPATIPVVAPSTAPTGVTATAGCTAINLNWIGVTGATSYNVYETASGVTTTKTSATTSYTDAGLTQGATYYYQITAVNSAGEGPKSATVNTTTKSSCTVMGGSIQGNALTLSTAVSTLAGTAGKLGYVDATGASAQFNSPASVTTDGANLYVADAGNNVIRKIVISTGAVSTLAGAGPTSPGTTDGTGTDAKFNGPQGITTDGTDLYVADTQSGSIRKITPTGFVTTLPLTIPLSAPAAITFDGANLYIADTGSSYIREISRAGATVNNTFALVPTPQGITFDGTGLNFYVTSKNTVTKVTQAGAPSIFATPTGLISPQGITTDGTNLYVANTANDTILQIPIATPASPTIIAGATGISGSTDATLGVNARFYLPGGITTDGTNLYITDTGNQTIRKIQ